MAVRQSAQREHAVDAPERLVLRRLIIEWTDVDFFWKHEVDDAIYSPPGRPLIRAGQSDSRFIGTQVNATVSWEISKHLSVGIYYSHFFAGPAVTETGSRGVDFVGSWVTFQF